MRALRTVPCATCGRMPTDIYSDGSPRYDHGHDATTGETWWVSRDVASGSPRRCPACQHDHAVGTTCRACQECRKGDLVAIAEEVFADLLPGGIGAYEALLQHNHNLGRDRACDGSCGLLHCRRPDFDDAGLTRYRDTADDQPGALTGDHEEA